MIYVPERELLANMMNDKLVGPRHNERDFESSIIDYECLEVCTHGRDGRDKWYREVKIK